VHCDVLARIGTLVLNQLIGTIGRAPVPGPTSHTISLTGYIEKVTGTCALYGQGEGPEVSDDEEEETD
jgi:hypothetical protein